MEVPGSYLPVRMVRTDQDDTNSVQEAKVFSQFYNFNPNHVNFSLENYDTLVKSTPHFNPYLKRNPGEHMLQ